MWRVKKIAKPGKNKIWASVDSFQRKCHHQHCLKAYSQHLAMDQIQHGERLVEGQKLEEKSVKHNSAFPF